MAFVFSDNTTTQQSCDCLTEKEVAFIAEQLRGQKF